MVGICRGDLRDPVPVHPRRRARRAWLRARRSVRSRHGPRTTATLRAGASIQTGIGSTRSPKAGMAPMRRRSNTVSSGSASPTGVRRRACRSLSIRPGAPRSTSSSAFPSRSPQAGSSSARQFRPARGRSTCRRKLPALQTRDSNTGAAPSETGAGPSPPPSPPTTALSSSGMRSAPGRRVTFTATVRPPPDAGTIRFTDRGATIYRCAASRVTARSGRARCSITYRRAGKHVIAAEYSGDAYFGASRSRKLRTSLPRPPAAGMLVAVRRGRRRRDLGLSKKLAGSRPETPYPGRIAVAPKRLVC